MSKTLEECFESTKDAKYQDEKVQSNILCVSLVKSYREMESLRGTEDYIKYEEKNKWLFDACNEIEKIPTINFDSLKMQIDPQYKSCDCFFYFAEKSEEKRSLLIEFKNVNRRKVLELLSSEADDSFYCKVKDSISVIKNNVDFKDGYSGDDLVRRIHFIIVYGERVDMALSAELGFGKAERIEKNERGRQRRAVSLTKDRKQVFSSKMEEEIINGFGEKMQKLKLAACEKGYFGIPVSDPKGVKNKGVGTLFYFTMFTKYDFARVIEDVGFFSDWKWGLYEKYVNENHVEE